MDFIAFLVESGLQDQSDNWGGWYDADLELPSKFLKCQGGLFVCVTGQISF